MRLKIGTVELETNVMLGPMAGVTDLPFRVLCSCLLYTSFLGQLQKFGKTSTKVVFANHVGPRGIQVQEQ